VTKEPQGKAHISVITDASLTPSHSSRGYGTYGN